METRRKGRGDQSKEEVRGLWRLLNGKLGQSGIDFGAAAADFCVWRKFVFGYLGTRRGRGWAIPVATTALSYI